ncbi:hypothetical protein [Paenibacillus nuruki]|uniref:hypothetical protein n=1 Tax=Paenibacillus nuruki TaxID=1886670 RepID=UPI002803AA38|nr:hypothetical protein [Paenibacillus nuruki]
MMQRNIQLLLKRTPFALILLVGILMLAACGNKEQPATAPAENGSTGTTDTNTSTEVTPPATGTTDDSSAESVEDNNEATDDNTAGTTEESVEADDNNESTDTTTHSTEAETKSATGTFTGLADEHSAEIMVDGQPMVFQLSDEAQTVAGSLKEEAKVSFQYTEKAIPGDDTIKSMTITKLQEAK